MHESILLVAETGSDLTPALAEQFGVTLVPMHVSMDGQTLDDGTFPAEEICAYYDRTGTVPKTSAAGPVDFENVFDALHARHPDKQILHLAYSAVTTCSYQNARLAAEERPYVTSVDTKQVSVGQAVAVMAVARYLNSHPTCSMEEAAAAARALSDRVRMVFVPKNLAYLRAGGRVSNAAALVGNLLQLHPSIEIEDGRLLAKKKYRGALERLIPKLMHDFIHQHRLDPAHLYFICSPGLDAGSVAIAEQTAREMGYPAFSWMKTGCVITSHGGPGCFGVVGLCTE